MQNEKQKELIQNYITAYNNFDINGMVDHLLFKALNCWPLSTVKNTHASGRLSF